MHTEERDAAWRRLLDLLEPVHDPVVALTRRLCRTRADADDLFHEALLRALDKLHTLRDPTRFRSWFYAVLLSVHRSRSRCGFWRRFVPLPEQLDDGPEPVGEDGRDWEEQRQRAARASRALATLPAVQREAVVLFELEGFSIEEVADLQGVSPSAVKSRLARGRQRLRRHYERREAVAPQATAGKAAPLHSASPRLDPAKGRPS